MPKEYSDIKKSLKKAHPKWDDDKVSEMAAKTFSDVFGINPQRAEELVQKGEWESWKDKHGFGTKSVLGGLEVKAYTDEKGRFIEYVVASTGKDKAMGLTDDGKIWKGDNLLPECIDNMAQQIKNAIGAIVDPSSVRDIDDILRPDFTGTGHEHTFESKDIVPITTTVKAETFTDIDGNRKLKVVDKVNEWSQRADDFWNMAKSRILNFASIEYRPVDYYFKEVDGVLQRFVKSLQLFGKTFTGRPANGLAGVINLTVKTVTESDDLYESMKTENSKGAEMAKEETKNEDVETKPPEGTKPPEEPKDNGDVAAEAAEQVKTLSEQVKSLTKELEEYKAQQVDKAIIDTPSVEKMIVERFENIKAEHKNLVEADQKKFEEVKAEMKSKLDEIKSEPTWEKALDVHRELESKGLIRYDF